MRCRSLSRDSVAAAWTDAYASAARFWRSSSGAEKSICLSPSLYPLLAGDKHGPRDLARQGQTTVCFDHLHPSFRFHRKGQTACRSAPPNSPQTTSVGSYGSTTTTTHLSWVAWCRSGTDDSATPAPTTS